MADRPFLKNDVFERNFRVYMDNKQIFKVFLITNVLVGIKNTENKIGAVLSQRIRNKAVPTTIRKDIQGIGQIGRIEESALLGVFGRIEDLIIVLFKILLRVGDAKQGNELIMLDFINNSCGSFSPSYL